LRALALANFLFVISNPYSAGPILTAP